MVLARVRTNKRNMYLAVHERSIGAVVGDHDHQWPFARVVEVVANLGLRVVRLNLALLTAHERQLADLRPRVTTTGATQRRSAGRG